MSKRNLLAPIEPDVLIWARTSIRMSREDAARKINVKLKKLEQWESGEALPTINQLRKMANVYKRPLAVFLLSEPPNQGEKSFDAMRDFRRHPEELNETGSTALRLEIRKARYRRDIVLELSAQMNEPITRFSQSATLVSPPEKVGRQLREALGITYGEQTAFENPFRALWAWKNAAESLGVLVFQTGSYHDYVDVGEMRGCSINLRPYPIVLINSKDSSPRARLFTLIHELAHLMLDNGGICDLHETFDPLTIEQRTEVFCNHIAGATLVPVNRLLMEPEVLAQNSVEEVWSDYELRAISNRYSVSEEVVLRRLLAARKTTQAFYKKKREEYLEQYQRIRDKKKSGFSYPHKRIANSNGHKFIGLVLNAYYQDNITLSDVSNYLGSKLKHLPEIENDVFNRVVSSVKA